MSIKIWNYGSCRAVDVGEITLYFSYETIVAYSDSKDGLVIRKNDWSTTTGRHLNCIDDNKKIRISSEEFEKKLQKMLKRHKLN